MHTKDQANSGTHAASTLKILGTFSIAMIGINAVLCLRGLPAMASLGMSSAFFFLAAALCFLLPSALVCAEFSAAYPKNGGIFTWVSAIFGLKTGTVAMWLEWINNLISFPASLAALISTLAFAGLGVLSARPSVLCLSMCVILWLCTGLNLLGIRLSSFLSISGALLGAVFPGILLIVLGIFYLKNHPGHFSWWVSQSSFFPAMNLGTLALFVSTLSSFSGLQLIAFHRSSVAQPSVQFPRALWIAGLSVFFISTLATLSMCIVLPSQQMNWLTGVIQSFHAFFEAFHLGWFTPVLAALIALGSFSGLSTWLMGLSRGMQRSAEQLPMLTYWKALNRVGVPHRILLLQALICSLLILLFLFAPSFTDAFWWLITVTSQLTLLVYTLVFAAAIRFAHLRYTFMSYPWTRLILASSLGIASCSVGFLLGMFPPSQLGVHATAHYVGSVLCIDVALIAVPLLLLSKRKA